MANCTVLYCLLGLGGKWRLGGRRKVGFYLDYGHCGLIVLGYTVLDGLGWVGIGRYCFIEGGFLLLLQCLGGLVFTF